MKMIEIKCDECEGSGKMSKDFKLTDEPCEKCKGLGVISIPESQAREEAAFERSNQ